MRKTCSGVSGDAHVMLDAQSPETRRSSGGVADWTYIEPVDVLVPVCPCDGGVCDVRLLGVVFRVAVGLGGACHGGTVDLRSLELRLHGVVGLDGLMGRHFDGWGGCSLEQKRKFRSSKLQVDSCRAC